MNYLDTRVKTVLYVHYHCNHRPRDVQVKDSEGVFFYQIITEKDESAKIAEVQQLLVDSFISADLILSEVRKLNKNFFSSFFATLFMSLVFT